MKFKITFEDDQPSQVTVVNGGQIYQAPSTHPSFTAILARLATNPQDESVVGLFDPQTALNEVFQVVSPRVTVVNGVVLFDGDPLHSAVADHILRFVEEGEIARASAAAAFTEKVMRNPSENSREQLFSFLTANKFTITPEGDFVGYKAVYLDEEGVGVSSRNAPVRDEVRVDGELIADKPVRNLPGAVVTMPRSRVADNVYEACSTGLHVGTDSYARWFLGERNGHVLEVHVDPVDVVSVPTDHNNQKIRVCRYKVIDVVEKEYTTAILPEANAQNFVPMQGYEQWSLYFDGYLDDEAGEFTCEDECYLCAPAEVEDSPDNNIPVKNVTKSEKWDTRQNYTRQQRYPKGHPKAGQFVPKS